MTPVTVSVRLNDGRDLSCSIDTVYGNPAKPMTREAHLNKFRRNFEFGPQPDAGGKRRPPDRHCWTMSNACR